MKLILADTDQYELYDFLNRLSVPFKELGYEIHYITTSLFVYAKAKLNKDKVFLVKNKPLKNKTLYSDVTKSKPVLAGGQTKKGAESIYLLTYDKLQEIYQNNKYELFFMWNGSNPTHFALKDFAKQNNIKTAFFEVANIPGKIIVDSKGANAQSNLYDNVSILENYIADDDSFNEWKNKYLESKLKTHVVPQAVISNTMNLKRSFKRYFFFTLEALFALPANTKRFLIFDRLVNKSIKLDYDSVDYKNEKYLFFPMQVSADTQVLINSDTGILEAIDIVAQKAKDKGLKLLIKPHPAETDKAFIKKAFALKDKYKFYFVNDNTFQLIKYAEEVVTINSTVGLEAMIMDKPVSFLGRSFFSSFNQQYLKNYVDKFLINIDYFKNDPVSVEKAEQILKRLDIQ